MSLIAWYPLNGDTEDYSGNKRTAGNLGAVVNGEGKIGKSYTFSNDVSGLTIPDFNLAGLEEYTMCAWVNPAGNHRNYNGAIISSGNWNSQAWSFGLSQDNSQIDVASNRYNQYIDYQVPLNTWTHILSVMKGNVATVYVNGVLVGTRSSTGLLSSDASNTCIGRETYAGGYFSFNGKLNDVRVYDHALSPKEIKETAKAKVLHYKFDDPYEETTTNLIPYNPTPYLVLAVSSYRRTATPKIQDGHYRFEMERKPDFINGNWWPNVQFPSYPFTAEKEYTISLDMRVISSAGRGRGSIRHSAFPNDDWVAGTPRKSRPGGEWNT